MTTELLDPIQTLKKDLRRAAITLSDKEARYLVDSYYIMQDDRKRAHNQVRALGQAEEPHDIISWLADNSQKLENNIKSVLETFALGREVGRWAMSVTGIGPVISAGLIAYVDITQTPSATNLWSFAGLSPESKWEKGQKRPWNAGLKVLCWKAGESFIKTCNNPKSFYGPYYKIWKAEEERLNEAGKFDEQATQILLSKHLGKDTVAYQHYIQGKLPPAHIQSRVRRKVVKLFLSHWWEVAYQCQYGMKPDIRPYVIDRLGHKDYVAPPNWPMD